MAFESLQAVVGTAVIDLSFRKALLNGSRRRVIATFDLTHEEIDAVMGIRADSLEQFAGELDQWISRAQGRCDPPALTLPSHSHHVRHG
jgi:hypothetical protein